jgi:hypothetical protein
MDEDERARRAAAQEERAREALASILNGGDLTDETTRLSNEYTDAQTARLGAWVKRARERIRRGGRAE